MSKRKYWTISQIDATGVRGPHEKELEDISKAKVYLFKNLDPKLLKTLVEQDLGGVMGNMGFSEDWTITIEMFPEVNIHLAYSYFGDEFGDGVEAEFKFFFSGQNATLVPGEDSATFIDIIMDYLARRIKGKEPFEKDFNNKTELMEKVLIQRNEPFKYLKEEERIDLAHFIGGEVQTTSSSWVIKREFLPQMFAEIRWSNVNGLDISFSGEKLTNMSSYHAEFIGIFIINHILRYITVKYQDKDLPDICHIMFSRYYTKLQDWDHRTR